MGPWCLIGALLLLSATAGDSTNKISPASHGIIPQSLSSASSSSGGAAASIGISVAGGSASNAGGGGILINGMGGGLPSSSANVVTEEPEFTEYIENVTVPAGRNIKLGCSVKNLGSYKVGVGEDIGIHQTTANKIIWFVCQKIVARAGEWIRFPSSENEMNEAKNVWLINNLIPNAIGAVDCTHILIIRPHEPGDEFVNRKGLKSFNVQATCDGKYMFTSVDCSWPGSVHDVRIWRNSNVMQSMYENATGALLLADDGYGIAPWLITPYRETATPAQRLFNKIHAKERVAIECVFGQVKKRFPILQSKIRMTTSRVPSMILACFDLHNIAKTLHDEDFEYFEHEIEVVNMPLRENTGNNNEKSRGIQRRDAIAAFLSG